MPQSQVIGGGKQFVEAQSSQVCRKIVAVQRPVTRLSNISAQFFLELKVILPLA